MKFYFCVGCREVHYDNDYTEEDGDLLITDKNRFFESVERLKADLREGVENERT